MGNKANNDKSSILIDIENLLDAFEPAYMRMPKVTRIESAAPKMKDAAYDIIRYYQMAYFSDDTNEKRSYINQMIGAYGILQSCFKRLMKMDMNTMKKSDGENIGKMSLFSDGVKLSIAINMERLEKGMLKWRNSTKSSHIIPDSTVG